MLRARACAVFALSAATVSAGSSLTPRTPAPEIVLWAWQRPEDLRFAASAPIAYLAATARIRGPRLDVEGRRQPLHTPPQARRFPVLRIEVDAATRAEALDVHRGALVRLASQLARGAELVQIDYDARRSERAFYRGLLVDLRRTLPPSTHLSITALASWCLGDDWLDGLPVDEAVPMLFRLGPDAAAVRATLARGRDFTAPLCRGAYGLSTDEPVVPRRPGRRVYLFHPRPWTAVEYEKARQRLEGSGS